MDGVSKAFSHASHFLAEWWADNRETILGSMETHKLVWVFGTGFVSFLSLFLLGGAMIKNGVIFGLLLTASIVLLFTHGGKTAAAKRSAMLKFLAKHTGVADTTLTISALIFGAFAGVTAGIATAVLAIFISMLLHFIEEQYKKGSPLAAPSEGAVE